MSAEAYHRAVLDPVGCMLRHSVAGQVDVPRVSLPCHAGPWWVRWPCGHPTDRLDHHHLLPCATPSCRCGVEGDILCRFEAPAWRSCFGGREWSARSLVMWRTREADGWHWREAFRADLETGAKR